MNAPVLLAQLSGSTPQAAAAPRNLKLEKPANGQAVAVRLDGNTKLDFSDIASEKLTFVKVGEKLIVLFDNQSTVTIEPVFDSMGQPLPEIAFLVGQGRTVTGDEFAALFPITTDQSVLPAAGGTGGPAAGANFSDASVGALDANGNPLALLGNEEFGGPGFGTDDVGIPVPVFLGAVAGSVDDEGLEEGIEGGPGDEPGNATSITNSLNVDFGTAFVGRSFAFSAVQPSLAGLTSGGESISFIVTTLGGQPAIIGFTGADSSDVAHRVFTITLDNGPINGAYTFTLLQPLDHPIVNTEDTIVLTLNFSATNGSGLTGTSTFTVGVNDDSPEIGLEDIETGTVDEDGLPAGAGGPAGNDGDSYETGDAEGRNLTVTGALGVRWGADRFDIKDPASEGQSRQDGAQFGSTNSADLTGRALYFTSTTVVVNGVAVGSENPLTSNGETVQFRLDESGTKLIGYVPGEGGEGGEASRVSEGSGERIVFTVTLSDDGAGSYTFTLSGQLDHPGVNSEDDLALQFAFTARDSDNDTVGSNFTVIVNDDAPIQSDATVTGAVNENDLANFNPFYPVLFDFWQGSLGTSPYDGGTGILGTVPAYGNISSLVLPGADGAGAFRLVSKGDANAILTSATNNIGVGGGALFSRGDAIDRVQSINISSIGDVMGFFASDGRLVFGLLVDAVGNYNFRLFDQIDHPKGNDPATSALEAVKDVLNIDLSRFVTYTDFDGDTITLSGGAFSVDVTDDIPVVTGRETGIVNENDLASFNPLYPLVFDFWQGSLGTSPFDGFTDDGSITGLLGTVPVYGFLTDNVIGGADEFGRFDLVSEQSAATLLATLNGGVPFKSHGDAIDRVQSINIPSLGEAMGFFASDGRLVFGLFVSEGGFYNFRLFDQLDHAPNLPGQNGAPVALADTLKVDLSRFVTFTDADGDTIDLGTGTFVISVVDDIPVLTGQKIAVTLDESDLNNFIPGWDLIPSAIKSVFPVEGSAGTSPDSDTDGLLFNSTGKQGFLNEIIGTNLVNGGADEFGKFGLVTVARADYLLTNDLAGWTSKGEAIDKVQTLSLGLLGDVMGFFAGDRLVFTVTINPTGFYDLRLFDQIDNFGANGESIKLDLSKFVTYTDFDGDAIDLGTGNLVLTVLDDVPIATGAVVTGTVEEEQNDLINAFLQGADLTHGNEDQDDVNGDDLDTGSNPLATTNVTFGSLATLVKVGADENGTFSFDTGIVGQAVKDSTGAAITSRGQAVEYGLRNGQLVGYVDLNNNNTIDGSERIVFTVSLSELPFGIPLPVPAGLLDGIANDQFTFTLLDQIDNADPSGASTEDIKTIDLSPTIKFTDADGDPIGFRPNSFSIKTIDDTPIQIAGKTVKGLVEEEHNAGTSFPEMNHGNEDTQNEPLFLGFIDITSNVVSGDLRSLVSVGADEVGPAMLLGVPIPGTGVGTFFLGETNGLPVITSKGYAVTYSVTDGDDAGTLGDTLTATSADGRVIFILTITNNGSTSGDYTFTLLDQIDHAPGGGENIKTLDFSSLIRFSDFDRDTITLTPGSFTIDVIDDQPVSKGNVTASKTLDDEAQILFTPANTTNGGGSDTSPNEKSVGGNAGALFSIGADDVGTVTMNAFPAFKVIFKDDNGFAGSESVVWGTTPTVASDGATTWTATSSHYDSDHPAAVLTIRMDGSYTFTVNAPVVQNANSSSNEEDLSIKFEYTAADFDQDPVTGSLTIKIDDDMPTSKGDVVATTKADDEAQLTPFAGNDTPSDGVTNVKTVSDTTAGVLFSAGSDGVQSIAITTQPIFSAIYKDANGIAKTETTTWSPSPVIGNDGSATWTAKGNTTTTAVATLKIGVDGTYSFTVNAPLVHPTNSATEEDLPLKFSYTVTDGDGDTVTGSLTITVNDDTPIVAAGQPVSPVALDDDAQTVFVGNPNGTGDVADATTATGTAGALFTTGADGFKSVSATPPAFNVIYNANGFAAIEQATWTLTSTAPNGTTTWTASSGHYATAATLVINANGSYSFTLNAPVKNDATSSTSEDNLTISIPYTVTDGDGDTASGTLRILVNDDTPKPTIAAGNVVIEDETPLPQGGTNDVPLSPAPAILPANFISLATSAAGFVTIAAGADGIRAVALTNAAGGNLVNIDSGLTTLDGTKILLSTDATNSNLVIGKAGTVTALAIFIDPLTGAVSVAEYVAIKHPVTSDHNDPVSMASVVFVTVTDGDDDKATTATAIQVTIRDDGPVIGLPQAKAVDEATLPGTATTHGSLDVNFGTDGPAGLVTGGTATQTFNFTGGKSIDPDIQVTGNFTNAYTTGALTGSSIVFNATDSKPFKLESINLGEAANPAFAGSVRLIGKDALGNIIADETVAVGNVYFETGITNTLFVADHPPFAGLSLDSLTIQSVNYGFAHVDDLTISRNTSSGPTIIDGPVTFADQASAIANIHLVDSLGNDVNPATLTSQGLTLQYKLLDAVTLVAYTGATPTSINSAGVVFSVVLSQNSANPNGAYDFNLLKALDDVPASVTDLKFTFDFKAKDGDGDTALKTFVVTVNDDAPVSAGDVSAMVTLDDDGFGGNLGGNNDVADATVATGGPGSLFSAGADGFKSVVLDTPPGVKAFAQDASGVATTESVSWAGVVGTDGATTFTGKGAISGNTVATLKIGSDGSYEFTTFAALVHPDSGSIEENLPVIFKYTVTDGDNDKVTGSLTINVNDDTPVLSAGEVGATNLVVNGQFTDNAGFGAAMSWGGQSATAIAGWTINGAALERNPENWYVSDPAGGGRVVDLDATPGDVRLTQTFSTLVSGQVYTLAFDAAKPAGYDARLEVYWNGVLVPGSNITPIGTGFQQFSFNVTATGSDKLEFREIGVPDNGGTFLANVTLRNSSGIVDEDGLAGNPGGLGDAPGASLVANGSLGIRWGADQNDTNDAGGVQDGAALNAVGGATSALTGRAVFFTDGNLSNSVIDPVITAMVGSTQIALKSGGQNINYQVLENGTKIVGYIGADWSSAANQVFSLSLSDDQNGSYKFTLLKPLDHPMSGSEDDIALKFGFTARDSDGDTTSGSVVIVVDDDSPTLSVTTASVGLVDGALAGDANDFLTPGSWSANGRADTGGNLDAGAWVYSASPSGGSQVQLERVDSGYRGVTSSNGSPLIDLEASPGNIQISQKLSGLSAGQGLQVSFEIGQAADGGSARLEVFWNNVSVGIFDPPRGPAGLRSVTVTALAGDNVLTFREIGQSGDNTGTFLANVSVANAIVIDETRGLDANSNDVDGIGALFAGIIGVFGTDAGMDQPQYAQGATGLVNVTENYGADGPAAGGGLSYALTLGSEGVSSGLTTTDNKAISLFTAGAFILGRYESDGNAGITSADKIAFALRVDPVTGVVSIAQYVSLNHPDASSNNDSIGLAPGALLISATVKDGDGDTATQAVDVSDRIRFRDDGPTLTGTPVTGSVTETALPAIFGNQAIENLKIAFGADGPSAHLAFARDANGDPVHPTGIKSDGVPLLYVIRLAGSGEEQLVAYKQGQTADQPVFVVELTSPPNPNYVFTLFQNLDHTGTNGQTLPLGFSVVGSDFDGDTVEQSFTVNVVDSGPTLTGTPGTGSVTETALPTIFGNQAIENLKIAFGADGPSAHLAFARDANGNPVHPDGIKSDGVPLLYVIRVGGSGEEQLVAYKQGQTADQPVFVVELTSPPNPNYVFTLFQNLDHTGANGGTLPLGFSVVGSDFDGDSVVQNFTVDVVDGTPMAKDVVGTIGENETKTFTLVEGTDFAFGADGGAITLGTPNYSNVASGVVLETPVVSLGSNGRSIVVAGGFDALPVGATAVLNIPYTVTDGDGDAETRTLSVTITGTNDVPVANSDAGLATENQTLVVSAANGVLANDTDVDNANAQLSVYGVAKNFGTITAGSNLGTVIEGAYGHLTLFADGSYTYVADKADAIPAGSAFVDGFSYITKDPSGALSVQQSLNITVQGVNDAPVISGLANSSVAENAAGALIDSFTVSDVDTASGLTFRVLGAGNVVDSRFEVVAASGTTLGQPGNYQLRLKAGQSFDFEAENADGNPTIGLTVEVNDQQTANNISTAPITVTVTDVVENRSPDAVNDTLSFGNGSPTPPGGAAGWTEFNGHYYKLIEGNVTWGQARAGALAAGGYLVNITSAAENDFIVNQLNIGYNSEHNYFYTKSPYIWIGASDQNTEGTWIWMDGPEAGQAFWQGGPGGTATGYANWGSGEPNDWGSGEDYGMILTVFGTQWNDGTGNPGGIPGEYTGYVIEYGGGGGGNGGVSEDAVTTFSTGLLLANDTDPDGNTLTVTSVTGTGFSLSGTTVTFNPAGIASLQALNVGQSADVSFTYTISDGNGGNDTATATLKVNGFNDAAVIAGESNGTVTEAVSGGSAGTPTATGDLLSTDVDNAADAWQAVSTATASANGYGTFKVTAAGVWTYTLDNANETVNNLNNGQTLNDSFTVLTADGTSKQVSIVINGATDPSLPNNVTTYNVGATPGNSTGAAYSLYGTGSTIAYVKSNDPDIGDASTMPSATISARTTSNQYDYYKIIITQNNTAVTFDIDNATFDTWIRLRNASNTLFGDNDDNLNGIDPGSTSSTDSYLSTTLNTGTYYLQVGRWGGAGITSFQNSSGTYELQVSIKPPGVDPIVLDLGTPGIELSSASNGVAFDLDADGVKEQIGWTQGQDGLLVSDLDGSGKIESGREVFSPFFKDGSFTSALAALATLDSNQDGRIDSADADFGKISVWQDLNHDGITDAGEMQSLTELGITAIPLDAVPGGGSISGQPVISQGTFEKADGTAGTLIEVEFQNVVEPTQTAVQERPIQQGQDGADKFVLAGAASTILDYNAGQGDVIDITALLKGTAANADNIDSFVNLEQSGSDIKVQVDVTGGGNFSGGSNDVATLQGYGTSNADIVRIALQNMEHQIAV